MVAKGLSPGLIFNPDVWDARWRIVIFFQLSGASGRYLLTLSSRPSLPCRTIFISSVPVNAFVPEAIWKAVWGVAGPSQSRSATP